MNKRILPDTLDNLEKADLCSASYWQVYSITDGMGGPGIGDIAGRIAQEILHKRLKQAQLQDPQTFDFRHFIQSFLDEADYELQKRLAKYKAYRVGCSMALVLVCGKVAYTMNIGTGRIYMQRAGKLYPMTRQTEDPGTFDFLGNRPNRSRLIARELSRIDLEAGDRILLMSDGMILDQADLSRLFDGDNLMTGAQAIYRGADRVRPEENKSLVALEINEANGLNLELSGIEYGTTTEIHPISEAELARERVTLDRKRSKPRPSKLRLFLNSLLVGFALGILLALIIYLIL